MRSLSTSLVLVLCIGGCLPVEDEFTCTSDDQCLRDGEQGVCESTGNCGFADEACPISRRRFGAHAGELSETCVVLGGVYWVAPEGSDEGPGTEQQPFLTVKHGISVLLPGDGLLVRPGEYEESNVQFPPGESWERPVTIAAWPRRGATLRSPEPESRPVELNAPARFVSVEGFVIDGSGGVYEPVKSYTDNVRLRDCEIFGSPVHALSISGEPGEGGHCQVLDMDIHDNGTTLAEAETGSPTGGIAIGTPDNLVDRCRVVGNTGVGIMVYNQDAPSGGNVVRNNLVQGGIRDDAAGIFLSSGTASVAYNNVIHQVSGSGLRLDYGAIDCRVLHNTVYAAAEGEGALMLGPDATKTIVRNNIFAGAAGAEGVIYDQTDAGTTTLESNLLTPPGFVDADGGDFHLRPGSPAIDQGVTEPEVPVDFDGRRRPRGAAYDLGAFEY